MASVVFLLAGARPIADGVDKERRMRVGVATAAIALVLISVPLVWRSSQNIGAEVTAFDATPAVTAWAVASGVEVVDWHVDGDRIDLTVVGPEPPTDIGGLATAIATELGHPVDVSVTYQPVTHYEADGG